MYLALCRAAVENNDNTIELVNKQHWINRRFNTLDVPTYNVSDSLTSLVQLSWLFSYLRQISFAIKTQDTQNPLLGAFLVFRCVFMA